MKNSYRHFLCKRVFLVLTLVGMLFSVHEHSYGQTDTLEVVEVEAIRALSEEVGTKLEFLDSATLRSTVTSNLAQLLAKTTPVFFRNYGVSGLASISLRGTGANHTALIWNGIKLQLPSLQQTDYAILPSVFWDEIGIQYGPSISLTGADIAGGAIHVINKAPRTGITGRLLSQLGSFGLQQQALSIGYGQGKFGSKTQVNYHTAKNDFPFEGHAGEALYQQNAAFHQYNVLQHIHFQTDDIRAKAIFWYGNNDREIPRTITANDIGTQDAQQQDVFYRLFTSLEGGQRIEWEANYSLQDDELVFDGQQNHSRQHIFRGQLKHQVNKRIALDGGVQHSLFDISTSSYAIENEFRSDYYIKGIGSFNGWSTHLGLKQVILEDKEVPFIPSLGAEKAIYSDNNFKTSFSAKVTRHFRFPTFNDLFWNPGGNPGLNPEQGWSGETTLSMLKLGDFALSADLSFFQLSVNDWILWRPSSAGYWSPENLWEVNSQGLETSVRTYFTIGQLPMEYTLNYAFNKSTNKVLDDKQLIYVPLHQANALLMIARDGWFVSPSASYTGKVYTTQDNRESDSLPGYLLLDISGGYSFQFNGFDMSLQLEVDNLMDIQYQTLQNRAMPGRNFQLQLIINFYNQLNKNEERE